MKIFRNAYLKIKILEIYDDLIKYAFVVINYKIL